MAKLPEYPKMKPCRIHKLYAGTMQKSANTPPRQICPICLADKKVKFGRRRNEY